MDFDETIFVPFFPLRDVMSSFFTDLFTLKAYFQVVGMCAFGEFLSIWKININKIKINTNKEIKTSLLFFLFWSDNCSRARALGTRRLRLRARSQPRGGCSQTAASVQDRCLLRCSRLLSDSKLHSRTTDPTGFCSQVRDQNTTFSFILVPVWQEKQDLNLHLTGFLLQNTKVSDAEYRSSPRIKK